MVVRLLREEQLHPLAKLADAPVELRQLLPGVGIVGVGAHLHQSLAHTLQRQCQRIVDQAGVAHAQFLPSADFVPAEFPRFGLLFVELVTGRLEFAEELLHRRRGVLHVPGRLAFAQQAEQSFPCFWIPKPLQVELHLATRNAQAHMPRRHRSNVVRLIENHEVVFEQHTLVLVRFIVITAVVFE